MNKLFEPLRGTWVARDRFNAEDNRNYIRSVAEKIPADIQDRMLLIVDRAESTEEFCDGVIDVTGKEAERHTQQTSVTASQAGLRG